MKDADKQTTHQGTTNIDGADETPDNAEEAKTADAIR